MTSESYVLDPLGRSALADLEERKLMTHGEARSVLEKRERLELNLSATQPTRAAYARAIAYEEKCDALLSVRRAKKVSIKRGPGDHFQARRIAALYERALSRFGDDSRLWLDYVSFLKKTNQPKAVGRVLARACRANATSLEPWLAAARWELKDRGNATAARRLLQRALRFNGEKFELWSHYIAFELSYVERLRKRSAALGTPSPEVELTEVAVEAARAAFQAVAVEDRVALLTSIEKACASVGGHVGNAVAQAARAAAGDAPPSLPPPPPPTGPSKQQLAATAVRARLAAAGASPNAAARALEALDALDAPRRDRVACAVKAARGEPLDARSSAARAAAVAHARGVRTCRA